jgi:hypothetical protein
MLARAAYRREACRRKAVALGGVGAFESTIRSAEDTVFDISQKWKSSGLRAGPVLKHSFSALGAFENTGGFHGRLVAKIFPVRIAAGSGALHIRNDVKVHGIVFLFQADQFDLGIAWREGERTQELGYQGIAWRNTIDIDTLVVEFERGDTHVR